MADFSFIHPQWLFAALPLALILPWVKNKATKAGLIAPHLTKLLSMPGSVGVKNKRWPLALLAITWLLSVIALAGPSWQKREMPAVNFGGARVLVMDMSRSMYATDIPPNRLTQARFKALDMLPGWKEGSTGLVTYTADGYIVSPLTEDAETLSTLIPNLSPAIMPISGSNAAAGVIQAIDLLKQADFTQGDIIIITDGMTKKESTATLSALSGLDYRVSILAVGTQQGAPILLPDGRLLEQFGQPVIAKLALDTLSPITKKTGGILQMWQPTNRDVDNIVAFTATSKNAKARDNKKTVEEQVNDGFWLLFPIILFTLLGFRRGAVLMMLVVLLPPAPVTAAPFETNDQRAYQSFQSGEYQQAADGFTSPSWKGIAQYKSGDYQGAIDTLSPLTDNTSRYNLGNAYAQAGELEKAMETYSDLLKTDTNNVDAKNNLDVIKKALEKKEEEEKQKKDGSDQQEQDQEKQDQQEQDKQNDAEKSKSQGKPGDKGKPGEESEKGQDQDKGEKNDKQPQNDQKSNESKEENDKNQQGDNKSQKEKDQEAKDQNAKNNPDQKEDKPSKAEQAELDKKEKAKEEENEAAKAAQESDDPADENTKEGVNEAGKAGEGSDGLTASHPVLKKLEQVKDNTAGLIQAQLYLQAQEKQKPKPTENTW